MKHPQVGSRCKRHSACSDKDNASHRVAEVLGHLAESFHTKATTPSLHTPSSERHTGRAVPPFCSIGVDR